MPTCQAGELLRWEEDNRISWIQDIVNPKARQWEEFYRNRWQHDRVVRSTHGVNCTGGCSWMVYVKDGIITWEMQATDYPRLEAGLPLYEPRGCQRGISFSWYIYSPIRVKYPYLRGVLMNLWRKAKSSQADPVAAWASIVEDEARRRSFHQARGKGGFRRATWDEVLEIMAASTIYTVKKYGPDWVIGFSPIPAMSMLSYAGGARFLQLLGGVALSFYDWYSDIPPASPEICYNILAFESQGEKAPLRGLFVLGRKREGYITPSQQLGRLVFGLFYPLVDEPLPGLEGFSIIRPLDLPG